MVNEVNIVNEKFFNLPLEKQQRIINAAYEVFSMNTYKKASMADIADAGGISKSLLFHYFKNKKELYMFLWTEALKAVKKRIAEYRALETSDFFEMLYRSMIAKCSLMKDCPYLSAFLLRAYYDTTPDLARDVQQNYYENYVLSQNITFDKIDYSIFRDDIDLKMMYTEIFYAIDGYMLSKFRVGQRMTDEMENEIGILINFWKKAYTER